ncbi:MAG: C39 family peptidase [Eubacteriales bacterium]|nr:C39 family peptidase [Eubacteriales bacterium]
MTEKKIEVPYIDQTDRWPTGCESVSAVMLLHFLGISVSVDEFVDGYLPKRPMERREEGLVGPDPNLFFAGSPYDPDSFGCYPGVLVQALNALFTERGLPYLAQDATGTETERLLREQIDEGMPVLYWTSIDLKPTYRGPEWTLPDGSTFTWVSNEHCLLLVGYREGEPSLSGDGMPQETGAVRGAADILYCNDPWHNHGCIAYDRALVEARHREQGERAVVVRRVAES